MRIIRNWEIEQECVHCGTLLGVAITDLYSITYTVNGKVNSKGNFFICSAENCGTKNEVKRPVPRSLRGLIKSAKTQELKY